MINLSFVLGAVPIEWLKGYFVLLYIGRGDKYECNNSIGISLFCMVDMLHEITRIRKCVSGLFRELQCGFRNDRLCVEQVFVM